MKSFKLLMTGFAALWLLASCGGGSGCSALLPLFDGETFIYFNDKGELAIKPEVNVTETSMFFEDCAVVCVETGEGERYGYLDTKGKLAIPAKYLSATIFRDGLAWVVSPDKAPTAINRKGEEIFVLPQAEDVITFSEGLASFSVRDEEGALKYGYVDKSGNVVIQPAYDSSDLFSNGMAAVSTDGKYGYINSKGEMVIAAQFEAAGMFNANGYAVVKTSDDKFCIIDRKGVCTANVEYEEIAADGNRFIVMKNKKFGVTDKNGKELVPLQFSRLYPSGGSGLMQASIDGRKFGYIDSRGKFAIEPQFDLVCAFAGNAAIAASGKYGIINKKGKFIVNPVYDQTISVIERILFPMNLSEYTTVESDFFDMATIVANLLDSKETGDLRGLGKATTYSAVKQLFPDLKSNNYGFYRTTMREDLGSGVFIALTAFKFDGNVEKREYDFYERKWTTTEQNPPIKSITYNILFPDDKKRAKRAALAKAVGRELQDRFSLPALSETAKKSVYGDDTWTFEVEYSSDVLTVHVTYL